jgi:hypothetical protein
MKITEIGNQQLAVSPHNSDLAQIKEMDGFRKSQKSRRLNADC